MTIRTNASRIRDLECSGCPQIYGDDGCLVDFAPLECLRYAPDDEIESAVDDAVDNVLDELERAVEKWGKQSALHECDPLRGIAIVVAEAGEAIETQTKNEGPARAYAELMQVAATAIAQMARIDVQTGGEAAS